MLHESTNALHEIIWKVLYTQWVPIDDRTCHHTTRIRLRGLFQNRKRF